MNAILETVNAHADEAREASQKRKETLRKRKKATRRFTCRVTWAAAFVVAMCLLAAFDLIAVGLAQFLGYATGLVVAAWAGAWLQFMGTEGGLFNAEK